MKSEVLRFAAGVSIAVGLVGLIGVGVRTAAPRPRLRAEAERNSPLRLTMPLLDGGSWSLDAQRGKVVLLNFWATWCPPCREETPSLVDLSQRYAAKGLVVAGVSMDDETEKAAVRRFVAQYRIPYPILLPGPNSALAESVSGLPTTLLIDRQGRVAHTFVGLPPEDQLEQAVAQLLE